MAGGLPISTQTVEGGYLTGRKLIYPLSLVISLFFLWGFSYGLLDVLNKHFQTVLGVTRLQSTGLQVVYFGGGYLLFSPIAAEVMKRKGYKITILMGLTLYSLGAVMFWPTAHFSKPGNEKASFGGFCACTLVIACGLATLETAANSYAVVIGNPASASARLQFCQSWNGVASFIGPLIASKFFFSGANANSLTNVQFVYLAVACAGVAVAVLFAFSKLPEVSEEAISGKSVTENLAQDEFGQEIGAGPLYKQYNMIFAFIAQFCYVGAQVTIASFFINYATENASYTSAQASNMLSYALITFTVGRFIATALATVFASDFIMVVYAVCAIALNAYVCAGHGTAAVAILIVIFFFEAPCTPPSSPSGAIADSAGTRISYIVPLVGFVYVLGYVTFHWIRHGMVVMRPKNVDIVESQAMGGALGGVVESVHYDADKLTETRLEKTNGESVAVTRVE
ncbi:major facilitator superfamily domain-containing protein [Macrophomina phaseolina]|uniref:Major facilitator superfamily domain-containing protein n=1 Tax=Macrophomina phaseolina TaxID=35725 RepID=A0ABQ8G824_9PEZI|nr:major facilitator superfamily domain-containing protein [Macrophomina phaseolina]